MLAGIQKLWIALYSDLNSAGFHCNGKRVSYSFKTGKAWVEIPIARDTSIHEVNDYSVDLKLVVFGMDLVFSQYNSKRVVIKYLPSSGNEYRFLGFDNSIILNVKYSTGSTPSDISGCSLTLNGSSKINIEYELIPKKIRRHLGLLYNWYAATDPRGLAPEGWHVPSHSEFQTFLFSLGIGNFGNAGGYFKEIGFENWNSPNTGATNELGFTAKGCGIRTKWGNFLSLNEWFAFWQTDVWISEIEPNMYGICNILYHNSIAIGGGSMLMGQGNSIRCIKNDSTNPGTVTDIDGNIYPTVKIGNYVWMAENLKVTKYKNGDAIPNVTDSANWEVLTTGARCAYNNDPLNI